MVMVGALATSGAPVALADTTPIARLTGEYEVIAVHRDSPLATMADLLALLRADPGSVSWAGGAAGGTDHILVALIAEQAGVPFAEIAYVAYAGGGLAQATLLGNQVTCGVSGWGELTAQIEAGNLRALAISAPARVPGIDVPTLREAGIDVELTNWRGVFGAPGLAPAERDALVELVRQMWATPAWRDELAARGWTDLFLAGDDFARFLAEENARIDAALVRIGLAP
jgi:putative tricarboxylic transport membrane protein